MPVHCEDRRTNRWALETLDELIPQGNDPNNDRVEIVPAVALWREQQKKEDLPGWLADSRLQFQQFPLEMLFWQNTVYKLRIPPQEELVESGYTHAWLFHTPIVNSPRMLEYYLEEVAQNSDHFHVDNGEYFESIEEMCEKAKSLGCDTLINCTGLGSATVCPDEDSLVGGRGVTLRFDRKTATRRASLYQSQYGEIDEATAKDAVVMTSDQPWARDETMPCYLIPRGDILVVGGTMLKGDTETGIRENEERALLENAHRLGIDTETVSPVHQWTGFRPYRPAVRCEIDEQCSNDIKVLHNYGHGGSGWTINIGTAKECVDLL